MGLMAVRGYEYDQELLSTRPGTQGIGFDYETIKRQVDEARRAQPGN